jgi:O-acetylhomoserine/O-acetylserine sulfhydrylase-like pyridoxal-dependent enzyme
MVVHPPTSSHRALDAAGLAAAGITEGLLRISVGLEDEADLVADMAAALEAARAAAPGAAQASASA